MDRTLPPGAFLDDAFLQRELATLFATSWLFVPPPPTTRDDGRSLAELVRLNGSRAPVSLMDRPYFLQRDRAGQLRMFANVCTHAWHTLVSGPERDRVIVCPQHGRRFDTDGTMVAHPGWPDASLTDHLVPRRVEAWGELHFACLGEPKASFEEVLAPVRESLGTLPFSQLKYRAGTTRELDGNWKQHAWNYLDSTHIPFVHSRPGGLADAIHLDSYQTEVHAHGVLQWATAKDSRLGFDPSKLPARFARGDRRVFALWWFVAPNVTLNFYPWGLSLNAYMPSTPQRTLFDWHVWSWDDALFERRSDWHLQAVDDEDVEAIRQVARGLRSGEAKPGRFAPGEEAPRWFHRLVEDSVRGSMVGMDGGPVRPEPVQHQR